MEQVFLKKSK